MKIQTIDKSHFKGIESASGIFVTSKEYFLAVDGYIFIV